MKKFYAITFIIIVCIIIALYDFNLIDTKSKVTLTSIGSALIAIIGLISFFIRLTKQQKQIDIQINQLKIQTDQLKIQINQRVDERFNSAINLLGSNETSARTGAIYALHELAIEEEKYRRQITQILCSHIRSKTNEAEYQKTHSERPSNEIQTTINLLFKEEGLYKQEFARVVEFPKANLSHAYLIQADFLNAQCQGVDFRNAQCQGVDFMFAQCEGADFVFAQCQRVNFFMAQCQGANFMEAQCQGVDFRNAQCQRVNFFMAQCQGANFMEAQCQGVDFRNAQCQGADLSKAQFDQPLDIQTGGEISDKAIKAIEYARPYLNNSWYKKMQKIIKENKGKDPEFRTYGP